MTDELRLQISYDSRLRSTSNRAHRYLKAEFCVRGAKVENKIYILGKRRLEFVGKVSGEQPDLSMYL